MQQDGEFAGDRNDGALLRVRPPAHHQRFAEAAQITRWPERAEDVLGGIHEIAAPERIAPFGNAQLGRRLTALVQFRYEAEVRRGLATCRKPRGILDE